MSLLGLEMHEASASGDYDTLEELIKSGKFDVNMGDEDWENKTPLHWACQKGYVEIIRLLLENGAKGTCRTLSGWTPAHFAAETGKITALRALHNASVSTDRSDIYGVKPSRIAEIYDHQECMRFLQQAEVELAERRERFNLKELSDDESEATMDDLNSTKERVHTPVPVRKK